MQKLFDIPHLLDLTAVHLTRNDLQSCILVNRAFYHAFLSRLHRTLTIHISSRTKEFLDATLQSIGRNGEYARDLKLRVVNKCYWHPDIEEVLEPILCSLSHTCSVLRSLDISHAAVCNLPTFTQLIHQNTSTLRRLKLNLMDHVDLETDWMLCNVAPCHHLSVLHIRNCSQDSYIDLDSLLRVGEHLVCLLELKIEGMVIIASAELADALKGKVEVEGDHLLELPESDFFPQVSSRYHGKVVFPRLRELIVGEWYGDRNLSHLALLVRQCPRLTKVEFWAAPGYEPIANILEALALHCQGLIDVAVGQKPLPNRFHFTLEEEEDLRCSDEELATLTTGLAKGLPQIQALTLAHCSGSRMVLQMVAESYGSRLRILSIRDANSVFAQGLSLILTHCQNLGEFKVGMSNMARRNPHMATVDCCTLLELPWVCCNLQVFVCPIGWPCKMSTRRAIQESAEFTEMQRRFFAQLSALPLLHTLDVAHGLTFESFWMCPLEEDALAFSWSLNRGLGQLVTLTRLKHLSLRGQYSHQMGVEELTWMRQHWILLESLSCRDENGIGYWVKTNWPQILHSEY